MDVPNAPPLFILGGEVRPLRHCGMIPTRPLCGVPPDYAAYVGGKKHQQLLHL